MRRPVAKYRSVHRASTLIISSNDKTLEKTSNRRKTAKREKTRASREGFEKKHDKKRKIPSEYT